VARLRRSLARLADLGVGALALVLRKLGIQFIHLQGNRIGEFGASLGYYAQSTQLGWARRCRGGFVSFPTRHVVNPCYIDYWRKYVSVVANPLLYSIAFRLSQKPGFRYPLDVVTLPDGRTMFRDNAMAATQIQWYADGRPPLLALDPTHERRGRDALASLGVEPDAWFVALHVREAGYLSEPPDSHRENRNADVYSYLSAVRMITDRGGWVIRVGDPSMKPLTQMERVIDYVHTPLHSDWMDVFLGASCRFFLGTSSGLFVIPWSFGRPVVLANWESLRIRPWGGRDLFIPKLWRLEAEERFLTIREMTQPPYAGAERLSPSESRRDRGVTLIDNTSKEIAELVQEWLDRDEAPPCGTERETIETVFEEIVAPYFPYGSAARIGSRFLNRHRALVLDGGPESDRGVFRATS
jgi:putative glycosyltransferase (TIGR04372 family)